MGEATRAPSREWIMPSPSMGPVIAPIGGKLPSSRSGSSIHLKTPRRVPRREKDLARRRNNFRRAIIKVGKFSRR
jgi:hypothetical protein